MLFMFWIGTPLPRKQIVRRLKTAGALVGATVAVAAVLCAGVIVLRPAPTAMPNPVSVIVPAPVPPQVVPQAEQDAAKKQMFQIAQTMDDETEKAAPGSLGAMQAHSLNEFLKSHTGVKHD